ncbi:MAG: LysR family transcriptional regulator [Burkholderiales bacterium]|uniref:LysR family transcriptional regulator n=1 Tax=Ottowia pentelensis TaxID=511108 RepID=A0ABV6PMX3_9BURK|nr:LysR family transcriptional regulator [Ottowia sp.]MBN9403956.1 LysR family transcriptional regulator [Burkholderiales bacterium]MBS0403416.1 LysR family transcriptional regulator [Pseudomonadota bacterium]MBS0413968.1 LysR family transcriptional regulator [Pseudomonadota bacterium]
MELKQMRQFLAVAEERNFTRAAERLHMAQPPLTRQIRALEDELGTALFLRMPRGAELTEAGAALLEEAPNLLALAQRARERTQLAGQGRSGRLDVGVFGSGVLEVIPRLLARFHALRPGVRIVLHSQTKDEQIDALRERRIAVGFNRLVPPASDLVIETVLRESVVVALPRRHNLAKRKRLTLADLAGEPIILYLSQPLPGMAQRVAAAFAHEGVPLHVEQEVEGVLTAMALVAGGFGLCLAAAASTSLRLPGVVYRPLDSDALRDLELACLYRRGDASPVLAAFLDVVHEFAQQQDGPSLRRPRRGRALATGGR